MRKWPGLRPLIANVGHRQAGFLHHLPGHRLLQILARLHKTSDQTVEVAGDPRGFCQQEAVAPANNGNDARGNTRVPGDATPVAPARPFAGMSSGFLSTAAAVTMVLPPLPDLITGTEQIHRRPGRKQHSLTQGQRLHARHTGVRQHGDIQRAPLPGAQGQRLRPASTHFRATPAKEPAIRRLQNTVARERQQQITLLRRGLIPPGYPLCLVVCHALPFLLPVYQSRNVPHHIHHQELVHDFPLPPQPVKLGACFQDRSNRLCDFIRAFAA